MNITVYCGASLGNKNIYRKKASELGAWIGTHRHTLVYGGGRTGLMGTVADAVLQTGGKAIGIIPTFLKTPEEAHTALTQLITVETMAERKARMLSLGDAYIALPGGLGTLEEIAEAISAARLGLHDNPCIIYNINNIYTYLKTQLDIMTDEGFLTTQGRSIVHVVDSLSQVESILTQK